VNLLSSCIVKFYKAYPSGYISLLVRFLNFGVHYYYMAVNNQPNTNQKNLEDILALMLGLVPTRVYNSVGNFLRDVSEAVRYLDSKAGELLNRIGENAIRYGEARQELIKAGDKVLEDIKSRFRNRIEEISNNYYIYRYNSNNLKESVGNLLELIKSSAGVIKDLKDSYRDMQAIIPYQRELNRSANELYKAVGEFLEYLLRSYKR